jgi:S1-C subfamily serine protease
VAVTPASRCGLRDGDIIVSFADAAVQRTDDLHRLLTGERTGVGTSMRVLRGVDLVTVRVTPAEPKPSS